MDRKPREDKQKRKHTPASYAALFNTSQRATIDECISRGKIETDLEAELMGKAANYLDAAAVVFSRYILTEARKIRRANLAAEREPKGNERLTKEELASVKAMLAQGLTQSVIGRKVGVSQMTISNISQGKTWGARKGKGGRVNHYQRASELTQVETD